MSDELIEVLEVDQWASTGNVCSFDFDTLDPKNPPAFTGGDSVEIRKLFSPMYRKMKVRPGQGPSIGTVWYIKGPDGKCKYYKANYDSSG